MQNNQSYNAKTITCQIFTRIKMINIHLCVVFQISGAKCPLCDLKPESFVKNLTSLGTMFIIARL